MKRTWLLALIALLLAGLTLVGCEREPETDEDMPAAAGERDYDAPTAAALAEGDAEAPPPDRREAPAAERSVGLVRIERSGDDSVRVGQPFQYTLTVRNTSDIPLHNVVLHQWASRPMEAHAEPQPQQAGQPTQGRRQQTPADQQQQRQMGGQPGQPGQQQQHTAGNGQGQPQQQWSIGMLPPGESREIRVRGIARQEGEVQVCYAVDYEPGICMMLEAVQPDLRIAQRFIDDEGQAVDQAFTCDEVYVVYAIENTGSGTTGPLRLTDEFGQGVEPAQIDRGIEPIEAGQTREIDPIPLRVSRPMALQGQATVRSTESDLAATSEAARVQMMKPELQLAVDGPQRQYVGRETTFRVRVNNPSQFPAPDTIVQFEAPENMENMSLNTQQIAYEDNAFRLGTLDPGQSREFAITFDAADPGQMQARFVARAYCAADAEQTLTTDFRGIPAVQLSCIDRTDPVEVGQETVYEIRVVNEGSAPDMNIQVRAQLPENLEFVSSEGDSRVSPSGQQLQFEPIQSLEPGQAASWNVRTRATSPGKILFRLEMTTNTRKRAAITSEPTTLY